MRGREEGRPNDTNAIIAGQTLAEEPQAVTPETHVRVEDSQHLLFVPEESAPKTGIGPRCEAQVLGVVEIVTILLDDATSKVFARAQAVVDHDRPRRDTDGSPHGVQASFDLRALTVVNNHHRDSCRTVIRG